MALARGGPSPTDALQRWLKEGTTLDGTRLALASTTGGGFSGTVRASDPLDAVVALPTAKEARRRGAPPPGRQRSTSSSTRAAAASKLYRAPALPPPEPAGLAFLPIELLERIFGHLRPKELCRVAQTCRRLRTAANTNLLVRPLPPSPAPHFLLSR